MVAIDPPQSVVNESVGTIELCVTKKFQTVGDVALNLQYNEDIASGIRNILLLNVLVNYLLSMLSSFSWI